MRILLKFIFNCNASPKRFFYFHVSWAKYFGKHDVKFFRKKFTIIHVPRNRIPICFLFHGMVRNEIPRVLLQFCSAVRNSEHFCLRRNGFRTEFRDFCVPHNRRNFVGINKFFRLFRLPQNNFFVGICQPYSRCNSGPRGEDTSLKTNILGLFLWKIESKKSGKDVIQNFYQKNIVYKT